MKNLPKLLFVLAALILLVGVLRVVSVRRHHWSADQKILLRKAQ